MNLEKTKLLSICIPTFNRRDRLVGAVNNIINCIGKISDASIEILISDNKSDDNSSEAIKKINYPINLFTQPTNLGYDNNVKFLYDKAMGKYLFFVADDDLIIEESFIELYNTILKNSAIDCFLLNFLEGEVTINNRFSYLILSNDLFTFKDLGDNFYKPFVFLSGFFLKKRKIDWNKISFNTFSV